MAGQGIDIGGIYADLDIRTGNLDQGLAKARQALTAVEKEIEQLQEDFRNGAITAADFSARMTALGTTATELTTRMQAAYSATTTLSTGLEIINQRANQVTQSSARMGQALMQLGYIADDIQYGFSGVVNNIGPLVYGLGAGSGVAAAAQLAAVAVYQLYTHWDQFTELIGMGTVRTEAEEMERLANATSRTADEQARLNKYKEESKEIQQMMGGKSQSEQDTNKFVQDIFQEAGQGNIVGHLAGGMMRSKTDEEQKHLDDLDARIAKLKAEQARTNEADTGLIGGLTNQRADAERIILEKINTKAVEDAERLMNRAKKVGQEGDDARTRIMKAFGDPNHPLYSVAMQLQSASPEARAHAQKVEAESEEQNKRDKEAADKAKKDKEDAERDREKELGRMGYLEEKAAKGTATKGERAELVRLFQADAEQQRSKDEQKQKEIDADRKKELGPIGFLEEQATKRKLKPGEQAELKRLKATEAEKNEREAQQARRENEREARKTAPGIGEQSEFLAMQALGGAITPAQAMAAIEKQLRANGFDAAKSVDTAKDIYDEADKDVREGITKRMFEGRGEKSGTSEVFDASTLAARFQSSVGGDIEKKQLSVMEQMEKHLDMMAKNGQLNIRVAQGAGG